MLRPHVRRKSLPMLYVLCIVLAIPLILLAALITATPATASTNLNSLLGYSPEDLARVWEEEKLLFERGIDEEQLLSRAPPDALLLTRQWSSAADEAKQAGCTTPAKGWAVHFEVGEPRQDVEGILSTSECRIGASSKEATV